MSKFVHSRTKRRAQRAEKQGKCLFGNLMYCNLHLTWIATLCTWDLPHILQSSYDHPWLGEFAQSQVLDASSPFLFASPIHPIQPNLFTTCPGTVNSKATVLSLSWIARRAAAGRRTDFKILIYENHHNVPQKWFEDLSKKSQIHLTISTKLFRDFQKKPGFDISNILPTNSQCS